MKEKIEMLKREKDFAILAHYYVDGSVQEIADYVGDSFYLSKVATTITNKNILFAGVSFMGESAKLLNPDKHVYMANETADCPMAHMADAEDIRKIRDENDDLAVVCYVNSTAEMKAYSDVCVTSSNALKVVGNLKEKNIFFIPDYNLGHYIAQKMPEKNFILNDGCKLPPPWFSLKLDKASQPQILALQNHFHNCYMASGFGLRANSEIFRHIRHEDIAFPSPAYLLSQPPQFLPL